MQTRFRPVLRVLALVTVTAFAGTTLLVHPARAQQIKERKEAMTPKPVTHFPDGSTQCLTPEQWKQVDAKRAQEAEEKERKRPEVEKLTAKEMHSHKGRGYRNKYFAGTLPWHKSLRDVNLCTGNLFKSFTDIQVTAAKGAGLSLQRTYNSNDSNVGAFGVGWQHAYDIRMEEDPVNFTSGVNKDYDVNGNPYGDLNFSNRTDFFGHKNKYHRDADGLYSPPDYLYDVMDSSYMDALVNGPVVSNEDTDTGMDGTVKHFIKANDTTRVCDYMKDRYGNLTNLTYSDMTINGVNQKLLQTVTDPSGRKLIFRWNNFGTVASPIMRIVQVDGPLYSVVYGYNVDCNLSSVTVDASTPGTGVTTGVVNGPTTHQPRTTSFSYTSVSGANGTENGLLNTITDPLSHVVSYTYTISVPSGTGTALPFTSTAWVNTVTEPAGVIPNTSNTRTLTWTITPSASLLQSGFSSNDAVLGSTGGTVYADGQLRTLHVEYATYLGGTYNWTYDTANNVTQSDGIGDGTIYAPATVSTYGPHGNVLTQKNLYYSNTVTTTYYSANQYFQKQTVKDGNNRTTTFVVGSRNDATVGNRGSILAVKDAKYGNGLLDTSGTCFTYTYDTYGRKTSETNQNSVVTNYTYGGTGDALVNGTPAGNLTQMVQDYGTGKLNRTTKMEYDVAGHVTKSTDPSNQVSTFTYNNLGQPLYAYFPAKGATPAETINYYYGTNGRTETVSQAQQSTPPVTRDTVMQYEAGSDRVKSVYDSVTQKTIFYTYAPGGERLSMTLQGGGTWNYDYNTSSGRPFSDNLGNSAGTTGTLLCPGGEPDKISHKLTSITDDLLRRVYFQFDHAGQLLGVQFNLTYDTANPPNLIRYCGTDYKYANAYGASPGWLTQVQTSLWTKSGVNWPANVLSQNNYTYGSDAFTNQTDNTGLRLANTVQLWNPTASQYDTRTEHYSYDELNRLTAVNYGDGQTQSYTFDAMGNRLSKQDSATGTENYAYNAANMLEKRNSATQNYFNDANGNTTSGGGRTNTWDSQNRLDTCVYNGTTSEFDYGTDGLRRRMTVTTGGTTTPTDYAYDGTMPIREFHHVNNDVSQALTNFATYFQGASGPVYRRDDTNTDLTQNTRWYLYDGLGSVLAEVSSTGAITSRRTLDVYGWERTNWKKDNLENPSKQKWVGSLGHMSDGETGLVYMRARYYDPQIGRFASQDPAKNGVNWYGYCSSNPINYVDSTGAIEEPNLPFLTQLLRGLNMLGIVIGLALTSIALVMYGVGNDAVAAACCTLACFSFWLSLTGLQDGYGVSYGGLFNAGSSFLGTLGGGLLAAVVVFVKGSSEVSKMASGSLARVAIDATTAYGIACITATFLGADN